MCAILIIVFYLDPVFYSPPDAFKGFEQGQPNGMATSAISLEGDEEPRRGTSRANSVRFDESAIHGYYGQASRSSTELPLRTGSGMGSLPLSERSLSHRSDGRLSSSGQSLHSTRTNSLGIETTSRLLDSFSGSPVTPPPGLFLLGPVPCIIRCWLTATYSNETLLYAAVCSGSYVSTLEKSLILKLGLGESVVDEDDKQYIRLPVWLPEASVHLSSSRGGSPEPQLPALTIRFLVRESDTPDDSIKIIIGSDVLRSHNADILFSKDKILMVDEDRNRISVPLVRPERDSVFKSLSTASHETGHHLEAEPDETNKEDVGVIGPPKNSNQSTSAPASTRVSIGEADHAKKPVLGSLAAAPTSTEPQQPGSHITDAYSATSHPESAGVWASWRRGPKTEQSTNVNKTAPSRAMKVLRPAKPSSRAASSTSVSGNHVLEQNDTQNGAARRSSDDNSVTSAANPVGGASAFGWLNPAVPSQKANGNHK